LIALPFQKSLPPGNSLFLDDRCSPFEDQWAFLSTMRKLSPEEVEAIVAMGASKGRILGIRAVITEEDVDQPWTLSPSRKPKAPIIKGPLPDKVNITKGSQIFIDKRPAATPDQSDDAGCGIPESGILPSTGHAAAHIRQTANYLLRRRLSSSSLPSQGLS
jgi:hypothetical protein